MPWGIIGHAWATTALEQSIATERYAHAYLISGPVGVGKSLLALRIAQALNCETTPLGEPCLQCRTCKRIERNNHPDVRIASMETQSANATGSQATRQRDLKIHTIREWQRDISLKPYEARRRIFMLFDAERLNEESSNAMLKTLEEPPPFATLILVANTASLLPTIISRCQQIRLRPIPRQEIADALAEQTNLDQPTINTLAAWSQGRVGWALHLAHNPEEITSYQERLDQLLTLQNQPNSETFRWAEDRNKAYRAGEQEEVFAWLNLWQTWWHDVLLTAGGCPEYVTHPDRLSTLQKTAQRYPLPDIYQFVAQLGKTTQYLRENVNPQLALENLFLHLPATKPTKR